MADIIPNPNYDGRNQTFSIFLADGLTLMNTTLGDITEFQIYAVKSTLSAALQAGACILLLMAIMAAASPAKRSSPVFISASLSLLLGFFRGLFLALFFTGPWGDMYSNLASDFRYITLSAKATSIAALVFPLLMTISVCFSLFIQVHAVCDQIVGKWAYRVIIAIAISGMLTTIGFRSVQMIYNALDIVHFVPWSHEYLRIASQVTFTFVLGFTCLVFVFKLAFTVWNRRKNNWKAMDVHQLLIISGICTLIIPTVFTVFQWVELDAFPESGSWSLTLTALCLPWSAVWASVKSTENPVSLKASSQMSETEQENWLRRESRKRSVASTAATDMTMDTDVEPGNSTTIDAVMQARSRLSLEAEIEMGGITVGHTYGTEGGLRAGAM